MLFSVPSVSSVVKKILYRNQTQAHIAPSRAIASNVWICIQCKILPPRAPRAPSLSTLQGETSPNLLPTAKEFCPDLSFIAEIRLYLYHIDPFLSALCVLGGEKILYSAQITGHAAPSRVIVSNVEVCFQCKISPLSAPSLSTLQGEPSPNLLPTAKEICPDLSFIAEIRLYLYHIDPFLCALCVLGGEKTCTALR